MICDTCAKKRKRNKEYYCAVLKPKRPGEPKLGLWGENCTAWTDDREWETWVKKAVEEYRNKGGGCR